MRAAGRAGRALDPLRRVRRAGSERRKAHRRVFVPLTFGLDRRRDRGIPAVALAGAVLYMVAHGLFSARFSWPWASSKSAKARRCSPPAWLGRDNRVSRVRCASALAALGLPGLAGFAGEIAILIGVYQSGLVWVTAIALAGIVLASAYVLRMFQDVMNGPVSRIAGAARPDVARRPSDRAARGGPDPFGRQSARRSHRVVAQSRRWRPARSSRPDDDRRNGRRLDAVMRSSSSRVPDCSCCSRTSSHARIPALPLDRDRGVGRAGTAYLCAKGTARTSGFSDGFVLGGFTVAFEEIVLLATLGSLILYGTIGKDDRSPVRWR